MGEQVAKQVAPAVDTLAQTLLGSGFILALLVAVVAIWQLIKTQNSRVQDQKDIVDRVVKMGERTKDAMDSLKSSIDGLDNAQQSCQQLLTQIGIRIDMLNSGRR